MCSGLKNALSSGCVLWVVCGGSESMITLLSIAIPMAFTYVVFVWLFFVVGFLCVRFLTVQNKQHFLICTWLHTLKGAGRSSEVERSLMVRWVVGSILHGVDPLSYFSFQPVLHDWCNKGRGMCYPVCGMVHIKEPLLLIDKSSLCGGSGFPFTLSEWSLTICLTPCNRR